MVAAAILKNWKIVISQPLFERFRQNLVWWCRSTLMNVPTVKNFNSQKSKMAAAAILKNWKIAISRPRFSRFCRNLAWWCISNLLTVQIVKNLNFANPRWRLPPSWKSKNPHILAAVWAILTKFGTMVQFNPIERPTVKNFKCQKSKMAAAAVLKNWKIVISRPRFNRLWRNFGTMMHFEPLDRPDRQKFKILQIQSAAGILTI